MPIYTRGDKISQTDPVGIWHRGDKISHIFTRGEEVYSTHSHVAPVEKNYALVSTGSQWIDTGYIPSTRNITIEATYQQTEALQSDKGVIGSYNGQGIAVGGGTNYAGKLYLWNPSGRLLAATAALAMTAKQTVTATLNGTTNTKTLDIDGAVASMAYTDTLAQLQASMNSLKLFCNGETNRADRRIIATLYSCKIRDNGVLIRDFTPVPSGSTKFSATSAPSHCLWDAVTQAYVQNAGTGNFSILEYV